MSQGAQRLGFQEQENSAGARMLPGSMLKATVCPTPARYFTDNVEERFFMQLIPPAIPPNRSRPSKALTARAERSHQYRLGQHDQTFRYPGRDSEVGTWSLCFPRLPDFLMQPGPRVSPPTFCGRL